MKLSYVYALVFGTMSVLLVCYSYYYMSVAGSVFATSKKGVRT
jgi:hypothetical protein